MSIRYPHWIHDAQREVDELTAMGISEDVASRAVILSAGGPGDLIRTAAEQQWLIDRGLAEEEDDDEEDEEGGDEL